MPARLNVKELHQMKRRIALSACLLVSGILLSVVLSGCGGEEAAPVPNTTADQQAVAAEPAAAEPAPGEPVAQPPNEAKPKRTAPKKPAITAADREAARRRPTPEEFVGKELVWNGSFELWAANQPRGWDINSPGLVKSFADAAAGEKAVQLLAPEGDAPVTLAYPIEADDSILGTTLSLKAQGLASEPNALFAAIEYSADGERVRAGKTVHAGDGEWAYMGVDAEIPEDADPKSIVVKFWRAPKVAGDVAVDYVRASAE